ncbi:MAG: hypothetical protein LBV79_08990 [Candidatus Adiutrix sp.]|jgi:hypothetical protein|nr:hypothetical protein [Candidatus Adiutrix sp.]
MKRNFLRLLPGAVLLLAVMAASGCPMARPAPFVNPVESRLILQVPFYSDEAGLCGPSALASVMTYGGRPTTAEEAAMALNQERPTAQSMAVWARREGLSAEIFSGAPEQLVEAVKAHKPFIVRLDRDAPPILRGQYAVVVGYTPDGPVLNSCAIHQQIIPWKDFLAGWYKSTNLSIMIESLATI